MCFKTFMIIKPNIELKSSFTSYSLFLFYRMEEAGVFITKQIIGLTWLSPSSPLWMSQI